jgi:hypothetical protein
MSLIVDLCSLDKRPLINTAQFGRGPVTKTKGQMELLLETVQIIPARGMFKGPNEKPLIVCKFHWVVIYKILEVTWGTKMGH